MRGKRAKALRTTERPNPGRKHGGSGKVKKNDDGKKYATRS